MLLLALLVGALVAPGWMPVLTAGDAARGARVLTMEICGAGLDAPTRRLVLPGTTTDQDNHDPGNRHPSRHGDAACPFALGGVTLAGAPALSLPLAPVLHHAVPAALIAGRHDSRPRLAASPRAPPVA